jgi:hypothetical protein
MEHALSRRDLMRGGLSAAVLAALPTKILGYADIQTVEVGPSWYNTGIDLKVGDKLGVKASGIVDVGGMYDEVSGPDGWKDAAGDGYVMSEAKRYSLIGAIGNVKENRIPLGSDAILKKAEVAGTLYLGVNDHDPWNNKGGYVAEITLNDGEKARKFVRGDGGFWVPALAVEAGKEYVIEATGEIDIGAKGKQTSTPKGWDAAPKDGGYPIGGAARFGLIGCVGDNSRLDQYFYVGDRLEFTPKSSGVLKFGVNDHCPWDNTGAYKVAIAKK